MRRRAGRRSAIFVGVTVGALASPGVAVAHPIGGRADLPVPAGLFGLVIGMALVATFVGLTLRWTEPRLQQPRPPRINRSAMVRWLVVVFRVAGLSGLAVVVGAGFLDANVTPLNIASVLVFVYFWLVVPFGAVFIGDWWRWLSPWRTLSMWLNRNVPERPHLVERFGVWPAALTLLVFSWMTLVSPAAAQPQSLALAAVVYTALVVLAGRLVGVATGLRLVDAFHTSNALAGAVAPIDLDIPAPVDATGPTPAGEHEQGAIVRRGWLRGLPQVPEWPGLPAFVITMIGVVAYDGLTGNEMWIDLTGDLRHETWFATMSLVAVVVVLGGIYAAISAWAAHLVGGDQTARQVVRRFAHVLVPVALAFMVSHYLTVVLYEGQILISTASDPIGRGWDLFGTADWKMNLFLSPTVVWYLQVAAMAVGQTAAMVLSHDRALADYDGEDSTRIQYALLSFIVGLSSLGLFLLAG